MSETTYVSSKVLIELQTELKNLSNNLKDLYDFLSQAIVAVNDGWQDGKYDEFVNEFRSSKEMVIELSDKYKEWANSYLPPYIELAKKYEGTGVGIK
jgi:flagellin-specific chaperone FliS